MSGTVRLDVRGDGSDLGRQKIRRVGGNLRREAPEQIRISASKIWQAKFHTNNDPNTLGRFRSAAESWTSRSCPGRLGSSPDHSAGKDVAISGPTSATSKWCTLFAPASPTSSVNSANAGCPTVSRSFLFGSPHCRDEFCTQLAHYSSAIWFRGRTGNALFHFLEERLSGRNNRDYSSLKANDRHFEIVPTWA